MGDGLAPDVTKVNFSRMAAQTEALIGVVNQMDQITSQLYNDIRTTFAGAWEDGGDGQGAKSFFDASQVRWDQQEKNMEVALKAAAEAVRTANESYQNTENRNRNMWDV